MPHALIYSYPSSYRGDTFHPDVNLKIHILPSCPSRVIHQIFTTFSTIHPNFTPTSQSHTPTHLYTLLIPITSAPNTPIPTPTSTPIQRKSITLNCPLPLDQHQPNTSLTTPYTHKFPNFTFLYNSPLLQPWGGTLHLNHSQHTDLPLPYKNKKSQQPDLFLFNVQNIVLYLQNSNKIKQYSH